MLDWIFSVKGPATRKVEHAMLPITCVGELYALLSMDWTCFKHKYSWYVTVKKSDGTRIMILCNPAYIERVVECGVAKIQGCVLRTIK